MVAATHTDMTDVFAEPSMSSLAKKVPVPKKTQNNIQDTKAAFTYEATVRCINYIQAAPSIAQDVCSFAKSCYIESLKKQRHGEDAVETVDTLDGYDEDWKVLYLSKQLGIETEALGKAKVQDSKVIKQIFRCMMHCSGALKIPDVCRDRAVMAAACNLRLAEVNNRKEMLMDPKVVDADGKVNWFAGVYSITIKDGKGDAILHRPSGTRVELEAEYNITAGWDLKNNHDDFAAVIERNKAQSYKCHSFFVANEGPNAVAPLKGTSQIWVAHCTAAHKAVSGVKDSSKKDEQALKQFSEPLDASKKIGVEKAREALKRKSADVNRQVRAVKLK